MGDYVELYESVKPLMPRLGTGKVKGPYQSAPLLIVSEQAAPRAPKSAERIEGAMMAGGDMVAGIPK